MDLKKKVEELVAEIQKNPKLLAQFKEKPVPVIEKLVGMDLPDDQIMKLKTVGDVVAYIEANQ